MDKFKTWLPPLILIILNFVVKGIYLGANSIAGDEPFSIFHAQQDVSTIIQTLTTGNNPPFYEIILHYWINLFGITPLSVRFPSLLFSCITVWFIYKIGVKHFSTKLAIVTCLLFIFSNYQIFFAHEARVYALFCLLSTASLFYFSEIITTDKKLKFTKLLPLLCVNVMLIYAHYFGLIVLFIEFLVVIFNRTFLFKYWKLLMVFAGLVLLCYFPIIEIVLDRFIASSGSGAWLRKPQGIKSLYNMIRGFSNAPVVAFLSIVILVFGIVKYVIKERNKSLNPVTKLLIIWFVFPFFFMFFISYWIPMFLDRYLIFLSTGYLILVGVASFYLIEKGKLKYLFPIIICGLFVFSSKPNVTNKSTAKEVMLKISKLKKENTLIIYPFNFMHNYAYYYDIKMFSQLTTEEQLYSFLKQKKCFGVGHISEVDFNNEKHVIYLDAATSFLYPNNGILEGLNQNYNQQSSTHFYEAFNVYEFEKK